MANSGHLENKIEKRPRLANDLTDRHEMCHGDTVVVEPNRSVHISS